MLEYISNQRETLNQDEHEQSSSSSSSTPDMFSDEKPKKENSTKNIDLGLSTKNESIGYYIPKIGELIQNKYSLIFEHGRLQFSPLILEGFDGMCSSRFFYVVKVKVVNI